MATQLTARREVAHFYVQFDDAIRQTALLSDFTNVYKLPDEATISGIYGSRCAPGLAPTGDILPLSSISSTRAAHLPEI
jgi:hypothetical protein